MGLLDDAIREHLELKRSSGADPGYVARLEREAFGAAQAAESDAQPVDDPAPVIVPEKPAAPAAELVDDGEPGDALARDEPEQATRQFTAVELEGAADKAPPEAQIRPDDAPAEPADEAIHDELEETPEFLQETPDHDRLWFEQKPPRDFDF